MSGYCMYMDNPEEPMAYIKYDFLTWNLGQIKGEYLVDTISDAHAMAAKLNDIWGEASHWVEPLNYTKAEAKQLDTLPSIS